MKEIHSMTVSELENLYEATLKQAAQAGKEWVNEKAESESWEDKRKPHLSLLMGKSEGSQAAKEQAAYSNPDWLDFLELLGGSRKRYLQAQVNWDMAKLRIEAIRTILATRREEIKSFRG